MCQQLSQDAALTCCTLLLALALSHAPLLAGAAQSAKVATATALRAALVDPLVDDIVIEDNINVTSWSNLPTLNMARSVTVRAADTFIARSVYVTLDFANVIAIFHVYDNVTLLFKNLEIRGFTPPTSSVFYFMELSPGGILAIEVRNLGKVESFLLSAIFACRALSTCYQNLR